MLEVEQSMLRPWLAAFERVFGVAASIEPHPLARELSVGPLECLRVPKGVDSPGLLGGTGHFAQSKALCAHLRALGFDWDDDACVRTAPTPHTFDTLLELATEGAAGYRLALHRENAFVTSTGPWLCRYLEGSIPVHVGPANLYESATDSREARWHLLTLAHDLTVHALNYHLIPRSVIRALGERIRTAVPDRLAALDRDGAEAPVTLAMFFDNDLNRYCYEVWFRCRRPADFAKAFTAEANLSQLHAALDVRIHETLAGIGDVPSDRADEVRLGEVKFELV